MCVRFKTEDYVFVRTVSTCTDGCLQTANDKSFTVESDASSIINVWKERMLLLENISGDLNSKWQTCILFKPFFLYQEL